MAQIDQLSVKFVGDTRDLNGKLTGLSSELKVFGNTAASVSNKVSSGMTMIGRAVTLGLAVSAVRAIGQYQSKLDALGAELVDMSAQANVGIEALQRLRFAAEQNGSSAAAMDAGLKKLNKAMGEAKGGSDEMQRAFKALGLLELVKSGAQTDEVMIALAGSFKQIQDPAKEAAIAAKLMGKNGDELVPILKDGTQALLDMMAAMPKSAVKTKEMATQLDKANDATQVFYQRIEGVASFLESGFIAALTPAMDKLAEFNDLMVKNAEFKAETRMQRNLRAAIAAHPVKDLGPKHTISTPDVNNIFGSGDKGNTTDKAFDEAKKAAEQYQAVIDDLDFELAQLTRTEQAAALQEEIRNQLARAGIDLTEKERAAIVKKVEAVVKATEAQAKLKTLQAQWKQIGDEIENGMANAFTDMATGAKSAQEAIGELLQSMGQLIAKQLFLQAIQGITGQIFGDGGLGGYLSKAASGGLASGGTTSPGNAYMVGERGPEMFIPKVPGNIIPNNRMGGRSGGLVYSPTINSSGSNTAEIRQMLDKDKQDLIRLMPKLMVDKQRRNALGGAF
ncbi:MAG: hypothetical protein ABL973_14220 [Micropepsaceae bacterium]